MKYRGRTNEYFEVMETINSETNFLETSGPSELTMLWFQEDNNKFVIDAKPYTFNNNEVIFLTEFHKVVVKNINAVKVLRWNRPFYCILDHDSEVGCKGVLFYGSSKVPKITVSAQELEVLNTVWKMLKLEMESRDRLQLEMLQMMLKRILILCTRMYKSQSEVNSLDTPKSELVREFNFLVEKHFKTMHSVSEYASLLFKSPKTLTNTFKKMGDKTPLSYIQDRIMVEARRLLAYTDQSVTDIAYELGFDDVQAFSRFFKRKEGVAPSEYKI